ncbi:acetate uptake transporter [Uliginosibacterium sp. 31-16]|uniref:acetate uptake transporter n=1 Tax=Uliginosibacterium sp. 31-16 TaxID=3068315 RepID=UPI00273F2894|nr:acetate uptake transporter [Uliginosibacterium sp. 31-16]MDP5239859.1 acetate uptake transporter [Uliginosibacterium sp. 31-16]
MADHANHADFTANPAPLGLLGFGMTTILLNLHNAGLFGMNSMILAMGIFYGGIAQVIAGVMEWKKGNTFGTVAFTSYGFFWMALVGLVSFPKTGLMEATSTGGLVAFLVMWGIFTAILFVGTFKLNRATQVIFGSLTLLFALLALGDATGNETISHIAGWEGIFCGASAMYAAAAQILNEIYGYELLPLGNKPAAAVALKKAA